MDSSSKGSTVFKYSLLPIFVLVLRFYPNSTNSHVKINHIVTTIERLDQGHLYPLGERRDKHVTGGVRTSAPLHCRLTLYLKSYLDSLYAGCSEPLIRLRPAQQLVLFLSFFLIIITVGMFYDILSTYRIFFLWKSNFLWRQSLTRICFRLWSVLLWLSVTGSGSGTVINYGSGSSKAKSYASYGGFGFSSKNTGLKWDC